MPLLHHSWDVIKVTNVCGQSQPSESSSWSPPPQLHYFDYLNTEDNMIFKDCYDIIPDIFCDCFDYHDTSHGDFYNRYFETCTESYFQCSTWEDIFPSSDNYFEHTGYEMPTSLCRAFEIDRLCGNTLTDAFITECHLPQRRTTV